MNFEFFFKYCFQKYIEEHGSRAYFDIVNIGLNNIFIFKTKSVTIDQNDEDKPIEVNLIKDYHFGLVSKHMDQCLDEIKSGYSGLTSLGYANLIESNRSILDLRPSTIKEKLKNGTLGANTQYTFEFSIEMSDALYVLLSREMKNVAIKLQSTEFKEVYNYFKYNKESVFSCIMERFMDIESYMEKLASNAADLLIFLTGEKITNYLSYCEFVINKSKDLKSVYNDSTTLVQSDESIKRFAVAYDVFMTFLRIYPTTVTNRGLLTINNGLNINRIKSVLLSMLVMKNLEANVLYIFNSQYSYIYDDSNDMATVILRYLHSILLSKPNSFHSINLLNGIETKEFALHTSEIFRKAGSVPEARDYYVEATKTADIGIHEAALLSMDIVIAEAIEQYRFAEASLEEGEELRKKPLEKISDAIYEIKYKMKTYKIDRKHKKYEYLMNEISKDLYICESKANELNSASEKTRLIREVHSMKAELIEIKDQAQKMNDEELMDIIQERVDLADEIVAKVNKRNIRQERKGISFKLERDMTADLRKMNGTTDKYSNDSDTYSNFEDDDE